jgi:hypothetical protein
MQKSKYLQALHNAKLAHKRSVKYLKLAVSEAQKSMDYATVCALTGLVDDINAKWEEFERSVKRFLK